MASVEELETYLDKWGRTIDGVMGSIADSLAKAGYDVMGPEQDFDFEHDPAGLRWFLRAALPGRPGELEYLDVELALTVLGHPWETAGRLPDAFSANIDIRNSEGTIWDDTRVSQRLRLDDDQAWGEVWKDSTNFANAALELVEKYNPKPSKRIWHIKGTTPGSVPFHPSLHLSKDVAKSEIAERLIRMLDKVDLLIWDLQATNQYMGPWGSTTNLTLARTRLEQGRPLDALRKYYDFLRDLRDPIRDLVNRSAGTLDVEMAGGFAGEEVDD